MADEITAPPTNAKRTRVLAIDDNVECLDLLRDLLEPQGYEVVAITNPVKALEKFNTEKETFDLVLLDYFMPQLDGAKTFQFLKKFSPSMKVILVTGAEELRLRQILAQYPFDGCIRKPFRLEEALRVVSEVVKGPKQQGKVVGL